MQIVTINIANVLFNKTMYVYCATCNYALEYVFCTYYLKQFLLSKVLYSTKKIKVLNLKMIGTQLK